MKKLKELREKSVTELEALLLQDRTKIRQENFGRSGSKSKNVKSVLNFRKDIARILTIIREKEIYGKK